MKLKALLKEKRLNTVCEEASCPNIGECFANQQATFMILGSVCTRGCSFCGVKKGVPEPVDLNEPYRIAECIIELGLKHVVITSVTRDDLPDGGAKVFSNTVKTIRDKNKNITIEVLIPDFKADIESLKVLVESKPGIIAHNLETVPRLYGDIRQGASYKRSLEVFDILRSVALGIPLKSGLMLGLGEKEGEVYSVFADLVKSGCSYLSIGQYLAPSNAHVLVKEYIQPEVFDKYKEKALAAGFLSVKSAPYVRSSYMASEY
jgi:lipoic acid synthetase